MKTIFLKNFLIKLMQYQTRQLIYIFKTRNIILFWRKSDFSKKDVNFSTFFLYNKIPILFISHIKIVLYLRKLFMTPKLLFMI